MTEIGMALSNPLKGERRPGKQFMQHYIHKQLLSLLLYLKVMLVFLFLAYAFASLNSKKVLMALKSTTIFWQKAIARPQKLNLEKYDIHCHFAL